MEKVWITWPIKSRDGSVRRFKYPVHGGRKMELMSCGHPKSTVISSDEGTSYCGACETEQLYREIKWYRKWLKMIAEVTGPLTGEEARDMRRWAHLALTKAPEVDKANITKKCDLSKHLCDLAPPSGKYCTDCKWWQTRAGGWISVNDRLPDAYASILAFCPEDYIQEGYLVRIDKYNDKDDVPVFTSDVTGNYIQVSHWMELPKLPADEAINENNQDQ